MTPTMLIALLSPFALVTGNPCGEDPDCIFIPPGFDCWETACGSTKFNFCDLSGTTLPADFFAPGSVPFEGEVQLTGVSPADTFVERLGPIVLPTTGAAAQVPIELVELRLVSCQPISVRIDDEDVQWDVEVTLSEVPAGQGTLNVLRTHANGGEFDAVFQLHPRFTFTRVDQPSEVVVFDTGELGLPPTDFSTLGSAPWVSELKGPNPPAVCDPTFAPGVEEDPVNFEQCCRPVGHSSGMPGHLHVTGAPDCSSCFSGACCNPADGSCTVVAGAGSCMAPGEYKGDGTDCRDTDADGIPDVLETDSCCGVGQDHCNTGTDPDDPDTDRDGVTDGDELDQGTDPCLTDFLFQDGFLSGDATAWSLVSETSP